MEGDICVGGGGDICGGVEGICGERRSSGSNKPIGARGVIEEPHPCVGGTQARQSNKYALICTYVAVYTTEHLKTSLHTPLQTSEHVLYALPHFFKHLDTPYTILLYAVSIRDLLQYCCMLSVYMTSCNTAICCQHS